VTCEADESIPFPVPLIPTTPNRALIAQCAQEVEIYRRQHPSVDSDELLWLIELENRDIADWVRWQIPIAVTELDQSLIAVTALVVCRAYERTLTKEIGGPDRPSDGIVAPSNPPLTA